jgi:excisionase family DNA binding protein
MGSSASSRELLLNGSVAHAHCLRTPEAAKYVALSQSTLTKMRLSGEGPAFVKVGPRAVAYRRSDLDAWLEARVRRSTSDTSQTEGP